MKLYKTILLLTAVAAISCTAEERVIYLQDTADQSAYPVTDDSQIRIKPLDRLTIVVSSKDPELAAPFNATTSLNSLSANPLGSGNTTTNSLQVRTVDEKGVLYMPIIGDVQCEGKTRSELSQAISKKIIDGGYISDAVVNIQFVDMKIYITGEVTRPGQYDITRDKINVMEALAMAGDMTIYGNRSNVSVIRTVNGQNKIYQLDLRSSKLFASPAYNLQQGDVVYVRPNKYKSATAEINQNRSFWISIVSTLVSVATLVVTITR